MAYIFDHILNPGDAHEDRKAITFIVTQMGEVIWSHCLCRHKALRNARNLGFAEVEWGGVLDANGQWVRSSFDHGDCYEELIKNEVLTSLVKEVFNK